MAQDLETFLGMSIASDAFRIERTYGEDGAELTQLVYLVLADGSELGPYIRKQFEVASGVGSVYNVMWHAQREGMRSALLPRVICCKESNGVESVLLEYIAGETLSDYVARTGPSLACACGCFLSIRSDQKYHQELNIPMICFCTSRSRDMASLRT